MFTWRIHESVGICNNVGFVQPGSCFWVLGPHDIGNDRFVPPICHLSLNRSFHKLVELTKHSRCYLKNFEARFLQYFGRGEGENKLSCPGYVHEHPNEPKGTMKRLDDEMLLSAFECTKILTERQSPRNLALA